MMFRRFLAQAMACATLASLSACTTITDTIKAIPVPHIKLPKLPSIASVTKVIPGMDGGDSVGSDDPTVPFDARDVLGYGHTLRVEVYEGTRTVSRRFKGLIMVERDGSAKVGDIGQARLGGHTLADARRMIESVLRTNGLAAAQVNVQIVSVENTPVVSVDSDVAVPTSLPLWDGMTVADAIRYAGGRKPGSTAKAIYIVHEGQQRFFSTEAGADAEVELKAGDIVIASPHL